MSRERPYNAHCPIESATHVIGGKWKGRIVFHLLDGAIRFNQLQRLIPSATQRMLTLQLRELERDGIISRKDFEEVPPRVEYSLTCIGEQLRGVVTAMRQWGMLYVDTLEQETPVAQADIVPRGKSAAR
jgi:DNA-binding HxlR family transcriptional regulator